MASLGFKDNPWARRAYTPYNEKLLGANENLTPADANLTIFSGGDFHAYINNIKVMNLEAVTISTAVETVGNYVMGRRDPVAYVTGKRAIVGSMIATQYDRHAILEQIFKLSDRYGPHPTIGDLWEENVPINQARRANVPVTFEGANPINGERTAWVYDATLDSPERAAYYAKGLTRGEFQQQLKEHVEATARIVGATNFNYSDQLPPFDLTLVGVAKTGVAAACTIFGIQITNETWGISQAELGGQVGISFVALGVSPLRNITQLDIGYSGRTNSGAR